MAQTNVNIRMDENLKRAFDAICGALGMSMTTAVTIFAKTVVREQRIPFEIALHTPNEETRAALEEVKQMKQDPSIGKTYSNVDQMMEDVLADV